jgi:hypothetical protein
MLLLAGLALADDVSGKWSGSFTPEGHDASNAFLVLKQNGSEITGTAGPDENQQWTISKGKIEGNKVTAEVPSPDGPVYKLSMVLEGDHLKGDVTADNPGGGALTAKIDLTKVK